MESEETFNLLKEALSKPPVLALPDFSKDFVIECDACGVGIGAILMQQGRPIAYFSQALKGSALSLSTYEKEMLALVKSVQKWLPKLMGFDYKIEYKKGKENFAADSFSGKA